MDRQQGRGCRKSETLLYVYVDSDLLRAHAKSDANSSLAYRPAQFNRVQRSRVSARG